jgi:hypothetical protein
MSFIKKLAAVLLILPILLATACKNNNPTPAPDTSDTAVTEEETTAEPQPVVWLLDVRTFVVDSFSPNSLLFPTIETPIAKMVVCEYKIKWLYYPSDSVPVYGSTVVIGRKNPSAPDDRESDIPLTDDELAVHMLFSGTAKFDDYGLYIASDNELMSDYFASPLHTEYDPYDNEETFFKVYPVTTAIPDDQIVLHFSPVSTYSPDLGYSFMVLNANNSGAV